MRARDDCLSFIMAFRAARDVTDRVAMCLEPGILHPAFNTLDRPGPGIAIERPVRTAIRLGADRVQLVEPALEQRAINPHRNHHPFPDISTIVDMSGRGGCTNCPHPGDPRTSPAAETIPPRTILRTTLP